MGIIRAYFSKMVGDIVIDPTKVELEGEFNIMALDDMVYNGEYDDGNGHLSKLIPNDDTTDTYVELEVYLAEVGSGEPGDSHIQYCIKSAKIVDDTE